MKKISRGIFLFLLVLILLVPAVNAQTTPTPTPTVAPGTESWRFDAEVTEVGKRAERSRQFINWVFRTQVINNHHVFMDLWKITSGVTLALIILVVAIMGLGLLFARKQDISVKVDIMPILIKAAVAILYTVFSYVLVLGLIQITELISDFFLKTLGGDKLFNIFFSSDPSADTNYLGLYGQRDFDPLKNEAAKTSLFLIEASSYTYFAMGAIIIIRQIVLWFLWVLAPFLALLMPFRFIRNIGWIWIGVFFQWAFYGPLFAIFLWALSKIWQVGIPFAFDFSRIGTDTGVIYPLAINILYGGPQQVPGGLGMPLSHLAPINSGNYVDTFAEYVISLLMLWVVIILPWWLLRIFRDYCCDGIYAMKNILMNMFGSQQRPGEPPPAPGLSPSLNKQLGQMESLQKRIYEQQAMKQQQIISEKENIKTIKTEEISRRMDAAVSKLSDIARLETQSQRRANFTRAMSYMQNPMSAESRQDRAAFVKLKAELSARAANGDKEAIRILEATKSTGMMVQDKILHLAKQPVAAPIIQKISIDLNLPQDKVKQLVSTFAQVLIKEQQIVNQVSQIAKVNTQQAKEVIEAVPSAAEQTEKQSLQQISQKAKLNKEETKAVIAEVEKQTDNEQVMTEVARKEQTTTEEAKKIGKKVMQAVGRQAPAAVAGAPEKPPVSIEEYEQMRQMWIEHYTKGEVPLSAKIKDRQSWVKEESIHLENVLNKIASANEEIRAKGLQEVADIIPFFVLGDMTLEDIAVYLRAKLSAAKEVSQNLQVEEEIKKQVKEQTEYVEVERKQAAAKEAPVLEQELPAGEQINPKK